jgi:putative ABC transport system permease protein
MYLAIVVIYGLLALLIAVPLGSRIARFLVEFMVYFVNFRFTSSAVPPRVLVLESALALLVPILAGLWPILSGVRITVREAIADYGLGERGLGEGWIDRLLERVRGLPRPLLLSLRNTFRRKGRLVLTLVTLVLAGTLFIAVLSVRASMTYTVNELMRGMGFDALVELLQPYRVDLLESVALSVPGVAAVESWGGTSGFRLLPDGSEGSVFLIQGLPPDSQMVQPQMEQGRWLLPEDRNAIVLSTRMAEEEGDVAVGDEIVIEIQERETTWQIVGIVAPLMPGVSAYASYGPLARVTRSVGRAGALFVSGEQHDDAYQTALADALEEHFTLKGLSVGNVRTAVFIREQYAVLANILVSLLMSMAGLTAIVGGISLMGTMLLNVLERIREVGVMRAIGARTDAVLQIFIVEGAIVGLLSWAIAVLLAWPLGKVISSTVGSRLIFLPLKYTFSLPGVGLWLVAAVVLSAAASYFPAQNAARLTVREVLSYE